MGNHDRSSFGDIFDSTPDVENGEVIGNSNELIESIITNFESSGDFQKLRYARYLREIKDSLNNENLRDLSSLLEMLSSAGDIERIHELMEDIREATERYNDEVEEVRDGGGSPETAEEYESLFSEYFGETWAEIKELYSIETYEDLKLFEAILKLLGGTLEAGLDIFVGLISLLVAEGITGGLQILWEAVSAIATVDKVLFEYLIREDHFALLVIWIYIHINGGLIATRYARDYITHNYGEVIRENFGKPSSGDDQRGRIARWVHRTFGDKYIDAAVPSSNIFETMNGEGSQEQNEYLKRKSIIDLLRQYYYDDPGMLQKLGKIENRYLQSKTKTFWRETYILINEHGTGKQITVGLLKFDFFKKEMESNVIATRDRLFSSHLEAVKLLFSTRETREGSIQIETEKETDFLKGIRSRIENDPSLTAEEKARRISNLDRFLNSITGNTILDRRRVLQEIYRIEQGYATRVEMVAAIEASLNQPREGSLVTRGRGAIADTLNRRNARLIELRTRILNNDWYGTFDEFQVELERAKTERGIRIPRNIRELQFPDFDQYIQDTEVEGIRIQDMERLYNSRIVTDVENFIRYGVSDNALERQYIETLEEFRDMKTLYSEKQLIRELGRIVNGFLPSNILLREFEKLGSEVTPEQATYLEPFKKRARQGELKMSRENMDELRTLLIDDPDARVSFSNTGPYIETQTLDESVEETRQQISEYRSIEQFDFHTFLNLEDSNVPRIQEALLNRYQEQIDFMRILSNLPESNIDSRFNIVEELRRFGTSLGENHYTKGQGNKILEQLFSGVLFSDIDIDEIVRSTDNHEFTFNSRDQLQRRVSSVFSNASRENKRTIIAFINDSGINISILPQAVKDFIEAEGNQRQIQNHIEAIDSFSDQIEDIESRQELRQLERDFNEYINRPDVDRTNEDIRRAIEEFRGELDQKRTEIRGGVQVAPSDEVQVSQEEVPSELTTTENSPETRETLSYDDAKKFLDDIYVSVVLSGDEEALNKLSDEYEAINIIDSERLVELGNQIDLIEFYRNYLGVEVFSLKESNASLDDIKDALTEIDRQRFSRIRSYAQMGDAIRSTYSSDIGPQVIEALRTLQLTR